VKCLVIGAEGFVGAQLTKELLGRGHSVVGLEVRGGLRRLADCADAIKLHIGDCADPEVVLGLVQQYNIESIYYGPFFRAPDIPSIHGEWRVMGAGALATFNLVRASSVRRVVFPSSTAVHGMQPADGSALNEQSRVSPFMTYGATKLVCEYFARDLNAQCGYQAAVAVRLPAVYGPGAAIASRGVNIFPVRAARGQPGAVDYTAQTRICVAHVDDTARILANAMEAQDCRHHVYDMGGLDVSFGDIAGAVHRRIPTADLKFGEHIECPLPHLIDNSRAEAEIGASHMDLQSGIDSIIEHERRPRDTVRSQ
jgi:nucleoside-diphosphate-sugar epimerase